eukprot:TRINITY_DN4130_c1_g2_i1.p1 TRINITY_DN4130_c1_g2~~TRINITY_DN4130_c1_g2_i1.p1  ORF type:complete len:104 (-),score=4.15 TRINITY_DN4130_c1_g2_i1:32-322(-)
MGLKLEPQIWPSRGQVGPCAQFTPNIIQISPWMNPRTLRANCISLNRKRASKTKILEKDTSSLESKRHENICLYKESKRLNQSQNTLSTSLFHTTH